MAELYHKVNSIAQSRLISVFQIVCLGALVIFMVYFIRKSKKENASGRRVRYQQLRDLGERGEPISGENQMMLNDLKNFESDSEDERDVWRYVGGSPEKFWGRGLLL